ncbi:hypothetical protein GCM10007103_16880 [Salinimicrobium marinum]|uniref:DUF5017 domain-containing protein n=1 Tax=Salinimicrobium marinum TaxID=680283 RepID=A0A918SF73_9FLAO|nr:hypothetical protein [Salinimicrobium marinum]GHA36040.1 hypothetical protein GCM10007103_16880 [Salinimicrobium marinum]
MKNSIYFLMLLVGLVFTGCEPMEDIHEDVDAELEARPNAGNQEYTLTDEDYEALGLEYGNFNSVEEANELLPEYLSELYPVLGRGSIANVTIDIYHPNRATEVENSTEHEVTEEEYEELGFNYGNFDSADDMQKFLDWKYADATAGDVVELTYKYYAGTTTERTTNFVLVDEQWTPAVTLEREDYTDMGQSYPNFSNREDAQSYIATYLGLNNPYAVEGDEVAVIFDMYSSGSTNTYVEVFTYNGSSWAAPVPGALVPTTLQFGHNGDEWEPDNTILYTMTAADFSLVGETLADEYTDPAWSAGNYANFDRREGNRNYWSDEMLLEAVNIVLNNVASNAEEGQKYVVYFEIYNGSAGVESLNVIKQDGEWILNQ